METFSYKRFTNPFMNWTVAVLGSGRASMHPVNTFNSRGATPNTVVMTTAIFCVVGGGGGDSNPRSLSALHA